ncbi:MAG: hypothetical protein H6839_02055 [Planctomycetes bacterium]|nr:hypothetical protein [Planctomycetota bacterium]
MDASVERFAHQRPAIEPAFHVLALVAISGLLVSALVWTVGSLAGLWSAPPKDYGREFALPLLGLLALYGSFTALCVYYSDWKGPIELQYAKRPARTVLGLCAMGILPAMVGSWVGGPQVLAPLATIWTLSFLPLLMCVNRLGQLAIPYRGLTADPGRFKRSTARLANRACAAYVPDKTHWLPTVLHGAAYAIILAAMVFWLMQIASAVGLAMSGHAVFIPRQEDGHPELRVLAVMGQLFYVTATVPYIFRHAWAARGSGALCRVTRPLVVAIIAILGASIWYAAAHELFPPQLQGTSRAASRAYTSPEMWGYGELILMNFPLCLLGCGALMIAAHACARAYAVRSLKRTPVLYPPRLSWMAEMDRLDWEEWQRKNGVNQAPDGETAP